MSAPATLKYDDAYGFVRPVQDGRTLVSHPFIQNGDVASLIYTRSLVQLQDNYVPLKVGTEKDNVWPGGDPNAYNLPDAPIEPTGIGTLMRFSRSYARIPAQQVTYPGSRYFPLPSASSLGTSTDMTVQNYYPYTTIGNSLYLIDTNALFIESSNEIYGAFKSQTARTIGVASGGTFTLTFGANTTAALNWNDSAATIQTALNGLASVIAAGLTATVVNYLALATGGQLTILWAGGYTATPVTMNAGSLTVSTSNHPTTVLTSSIAQIIFLPDHYTVASHGFNTGLSLAARENIDGIVLLPTTYWGSIDANTIWVPNIPTPLLYVSFGGFNRTYVPGRIYLLRTRLTEDFFLPGVSAGITTASDIPIDPGLQNPADFFTALLTLTGWQTYETEGPAFWMNGPIYRRAYTAINLNDLA